MKLAKKEGRRGIRQRRERHRFLDKDYKESLAKYPEMRERLQNLERELQNESRQPNRQQNKSKRREEEMQIYNKWTGLRLEITQYCQENNILENDFRFLGIYEWQNVYDRLLENFVEERYAEKYGLYWSNIQAGFRKDIDKIYSFTVGSENNASYKWIEKLPEIVKCETVYLFLEEEMQAAKYWIAECNPSIVHLIINDAISPTDYYITNKKFDWLITENHHDIVQFIGKGLDVDIIKTVCTK